LATEAESPLGFVKSLGKGERDGCGEHKLDLPTLVPKRPL